MKQPKCPGCPYSTYDPAYMAAHLRGNPAHQKEVEPPPPPIEPVTESDFESLPDFPE